LSNVLAGRFRDLLPPRDRLIRQCLLLDDFGGGSKNSVTQHAGRNVADTQNRITPAAVCVLMVSQPFEATVHQRPPAKSLILISCGFGCLMQSHYGGRGGQCRCRQSTGPPTLLIAVRKEKAIHRVYGIVY
jgi:hypothetical protein